MNSNGDRLDRIETSLERMSALFQQQGQINAQLIQQGQNAQNQINQLIEQIRTTSAGLEQLERTVDYLMRRDQQ